jgi:hypothetical protein
LKISIQMRDDQNQTVRDATPDQGLGEQTRPGFVIWQQWDWGWLP